MRGAAASRILMLLQNNPYPQDSRVQREATALHAAGHVVTVICPRKTGQPWHEVIEGVRCYRYASAPAADSAFGYVLEYGVALVASFLLSLLVLARHGFDVIHSHNPPDLFVLVAAPYKLVGKRFVFDHHDLSPEMYQARFPGEANPLIESALRRFERWSFKVADHVISTNDSYRQVALTRGGKSPDKVSVVRNGPDLSRFRPVPPDPGLEQMDAVVIGYVGSMGVQDGIDYLLRALWHLREDLGRTDFHCVLIGDGSDRPRLEQLTQRLGLAEHVRFTGQAFGDDLLRLLSAADICVCPDPKNPYTDASTMIKVAEYLALSKPVVAFDLTEHRATAGASACYAQPNDELDFARQLERLMDDPVLRRSMGAAGRQRLETGLTWQDSVPALLAVYDSLSAEAEMRQGRVFRA